MKVVPQTTNLDGLHVTAVRQLVRVANENPVMAEQILAFKLSKSLTGVGLARQSMRDRVSGVKVVQKCGIEHNQTSNRRSTIYHKGKEMQSEYSPISAVSVINFAIILFILNNSGSFMRISIKCLRGTP